jgi:hypothetical protein
MTAINWEEIIKSLGGQVVFLAAAGYLIKAIVSQRLLKDVEEFKVQLQSRADVEVERLKAELQKVATEHQIQFAKLHEKRALVIAEIYSRLVDTHRTAREYVFGDIQDEERSAKAQEMVWDLYWFIELNRIYLPETVCALVDKFAAKLRKTVLFANSYWTRIKNPTPKTMEERNKVMLEACDVLDSELPNLLKELQGEFRKLLGGS